MHCDMSCEDFGPAAKRVVELESRCVMAKGLLKPAILSPIVQKIWGAFHEHFQDMTAQKTEYHLRLLREECRKTASRTFADLRKACGG